MPDYRFEGDSEAAFMCECGASLCDSRVRTTGRDYDAGVEPVLADGHGPGCDELGQCPVCGRRNGRERRKRR
jgi:hypothetical protein